MGAEDKLNRLKAEKLCKEAADRENEKEFEKALTLYEEAVKSDPSCEECYIGKARVYATLDDYEKAEKTYQDALGNGFESVKLLEYFADLQRNHGRYEEAIKNYKAVIKKDATRDFALAGLAKAYYGINDDESARMYAGKALEIAPQNPWALSCLGCVAERRGDLEAAVKYFEAANDEWELNNARKKLESRDNWTELPTVSDMLQYLDRFVCGQNQAKIDLATAVYNHYLSRSWKEENLLNEDLGRYNTLVFGPSGCGKTYMIELLTKKLGVPLAVVSATSLVQTGYVGKKVDSIVEDLLAAADFDQVKAERGIVFIDEVDKVARQGGSGPDVSGEGVQNALLTLLEGRPVRIHMEDGTKVYSVDTRKVLFICAGAFDGISKIVQQRLNKQAGGIGFSSTVHKHGVLTDSDLLSMVTVNDLEQYGLIPQFVGRFTTVANLSVLSRDDLKNILTGMENSVLRKQQKLFQLHGIELEVRPEAIEAILDLTNSARTGARGLRNAISKALKGVAWKVDRLAAEGVRKIAITKNVVFSGSEPEVSLYDNNDQGSQVPAVRLRKLAFVVARERPVAGGVSEN